jgi:putative transposase
MSYNGPKATLTCKGCGDSMQVRRAALRRNLCESPSYFLCQVCNRTYEHARTAGEILIEHGTIARFTAFTVRAEADHLQRRATNEIEAETERKAWRPTTHLTVYKGFRYRVYPSAAQVERIAAWEGALRFLWNLALEQRLMGLARPKGERVYPTAFDQSKELTELRSALPWLADVPRHVSSQLLVELDKAWQRCFKRLARAPRWKRKGQNAIGLTESDLKMWRLSGSTLRFPKLGNMRAVVHRPLEGTPKTCTLRRDGDQWFVSITCEVEQTEPTPRTGPIVAIDRGVVNVIADSDRRLVEAPRHLERALVRLAHAQRRVSRRKKGSKNREKAKTRVMRLHRKVRRKREHFLHVESARLAKSHGIVVIEKLNVAGMSKGRCARGILDAGWSRFAEMLRYKLFRSGGSLVEVPAAYSSQTCSACGCVDAASRRSQSAFCCTACGHRDHADLNAAKILLMRAGESPVSGCGGSAEVGRPKKQQLRVVRRAKRDLVLQEEA